MHLLRDIRFWIIAFFLLRLIGITMAPIEVTHAWRQSTSLMVARNFYEIDPNILYPRLDNGGEKTGITGTEFPLYNYLIYLVAKVFGWTHWYGRLINLIVSSIGVYFFYKLVERFFNRKTAFYAAIVLLVSSWLSYSRKTMPDTFSTSLVLAATWYVLEYLYKGKWWQLLLFFVLALAGTLSKIPAGYLLTLLAIPLCLRLFPIPRKVLLVLCLLGIGGINYWWYFSWVNHLNAEFGFWHYYMGSPVSEGMTNVLRHWPETFKKFYFSAMHYVGFGLFLAGLGWAIYKKEKLMLAVFAITFAAFTAFIFKAGYAFYVHDYYILPLVPLLALFAGYALTSVKMETLRVTLLAAFCIDCISSQYADFYLREERQVFMKLESIANRVSDRSDLIAVAGGENPMELYMAHRKGWVVHHDQAKDTAYMAGLAGLGAKYLFINRNDFNEKLSYPEALQNEYYWVYRLSESR